MYRSLLTLALATLATAQTSLFVGSGTISVLNSTSYDTATSADTIGCLNADGKVTLDDCAVYTRLSVYPYSLSTSSGNCTFYNSDGGKNADSSHANVGTYAWTCLEREATAADDMYTVDGFNYPFICTGDVSCYFDAKAPPNDTAEAMDVWRYYWSTVGESVPTGHLQALWLWEPVTA